MRAVFATRFKEKTRDEWCAIFDGTDACVAPILKFSEAVDHPHMKAREILVEKDGVVQPAPAPRFSRTGATLGMPPAPQAGAHTRAALTAWGIENVEDLLLRGVAVQVAGE
jgi:alpha-methylacyl-CoA racemase